TPLRRLTVAWLSSLGVCKVSETTHKGSTTRCALFSGVTYYSLLAAQAFHALTLAGTAASLESSVQCSSARAICRRGSVPPRHGNPRNHDDLAKKKSRNTLGIRAKPRKMARIYISPAHSG